MNPSRQFFAAFGVLGLTLVASGQSTRPSGTLKSEAGWAWMRNAGTSTGNPARQDPSAATSGTGAPVNNAGRPLRLGGTPISPSGQDSSPGNGDGSYRPWSWRYGSFGAEGHNLYAADGSVERGFGSRYGSEGDVYRIANRYNPGYSRSNRDLSRFDTDRGTFDRYERDRDAGRLTEDRFRGDTRRGRDDSAYLTPDNGDRYRSFDEDRYGSTYDRRYSPDDDRWEMDDRRGMDDRQGPDDRYLSQDYEQDSYADQDTYAGDRRDSGLYRERAATLDLGRRSRSMADSEYRDTQRNESEVLRNRGWRNLGGSAGRFTGSNRATGEDRRTAATTNRLPGSRDWDRSFGRDQGDWGTRAARRMRGYDGGRSYSNRDYRSNWDNQDRGWDNAGRWRNDNDWGNRSGNQGNRGRAFGNRSGDQGNRGRAFGNRSGDQQSSYRDEFTTR